METAPRTKKSQTPMMLTTTTFKTWDSAPPLTETSSQERMMPLFRLDLSSDTPSKSHQTNMPMETAPRTKKSQTPMMLTTTTFKTWDSAPPLTEPSSQERMMPLFRLDLS